jgi:hypothetical protein
MSVVEAFVGDEAAVLSLEPEGPPSMRLSGLDLGEIDLPKLARLYETLTRMPAADPSAVFPQVRALGKGGPFVHRLPADFRDSLTFLGMYGILDCAAGWSGAAECAGAGLTSDRLERVLHHLVDLANSAKTRGMDMFVWRSQ